PPLFPYTPLFRSVPRSVRGDSTRIAPAVRHRQPRARGRTAGGRPGVLRHQRKWRLARGDDGRCRARAVHPRELLAWRGRGGTRRSLLPDALSGRAAGLALTKALAVLALLALAAAVLFCALP